MASRLLLFCSLAQLAGADLLDPPVPSAVALELSEEVAAAGVKCPPKSYYWGPWKKKHYCVNCPVGKTSLGCKNCQADPRGSSCSVSNCPRGKFYEGHVATGQKCHECPSGYWQSKASMPGCYRCPAGMFQPDKGFYSCYNCPTGQYQSQPGTTACDSCGGCGLGQYGTTTGFGATTKSSCMCKSCGAGTFSGKGQIACTKCSKGRFQPTKGHFSCYFCPSGKFQETKGSTACTSCPSGRTTPDSVLQPISREQCSEEDHLWCNAGKYLFYHKKTTTVHCLHCPAGMFGKISEGYKYGGQCHNCPNGRYNPSMGTRLCHLCPAGSVQSADKAACVEEHDGKEDVVTKTPSPTPVPKPEDCAVSDWLPLEACTKTCGGGGLQKVTRTIVTKPRDGGKPCPPLTQFESCGAAVCPIHCKVGKFTAWSACTTTCGSGVQTRSRKILAEANEVGKKCPQLVDTKSCIGLAPCPVDCKVTGWTLDKEWSFCTKSCGAGVKTMTRSIASPAHHGGSVCPALTKKVACNTQKCPVDCVMKKWSEWGECSKSCGGGIRNRSRKTKSAQKYGGSCFKLKDQKECFVQHCPVDCEVEFGPYSICSKSCGSGFQTRSAQVNIRAQFGGKRCPSLVETIKCNTHDCAVDCKMSAWRAWSVCSKSCGKGISERTRSVTVAAAFGGKPCPPATENKDCNSQPCPIACVMRHWSDWTPCSTSCGRGTIKRARQVKQFAQYGGVNCEDKKEIAECNLGECPVDCKVSAWNEWSPCEKTCGGGVRKRIRHVIMHATTGFVCPALHQEEECNSHLCPSDCTVGKWGAFSPCSVSCGTGSKLRTRSVKRHAEEGGKLCPPLQDTKECNTAACPVDCIVDKWSVYAPCSASCGGGSKSRFRSVRRAASYGGKACPVLQVNAKCNRHTCPVDCILSDWTEFGGCSVTCGSGHKTRTRTVTRKATYGGKPCQELTHATMCAQKACPIHCVVSKWDSWSECTMSCEGGTQIRHRSIQRKNRYGGKPCPYIIMQRVCNDRPCPVDCHFSDWGEWGLCSATCEQGTHVRVRQVLEGPKYGGRACNDKNRSPEETAKCNLGPCPVHCTTGAWSAWTKCSKSCGDEKRTRQREILKRPEFGGFTCPHVKEAETCAQASCPVDCQVSKWMGKDSCSVTCGVGYVRHHREVAVYNKHGGSPCPSLYKDEICHRDECPVDCVLGNWGKVGPCSRSCGSGWQTHFREVKTAAAFGGRKCKGEKEQAMRCNTMPCPVDCVLSQWGDYGVCSAKCPTKMGNQMRTRVVEVHPQFGGKPCGPKKSLKYCTNECPRDCQVSEWGDFSPCSNSCGNGFRIRMRKVTVKSKSGGKACPKLTDQEPCLEKQCPIHCQVGSWKKWGACSKSCGSGLKSRTREIVTHATHGGYACPSLTEQVTCGTGLCAQDCEVEDFSVWTDCSVSCGIGDVRGTRMRLRKVKTAAQDGGKACPSLREEQSCGVRCPEECTMTSWSEWHSCSQSCGGGSQSRYRSIVQPGWPADRKCPGITDEQLCSNASCPNDCEVSEWSEWGQCTHSCTTGKNAPSKSRTRFVTSKTSNGGVSCPALKQTVSCNANRCPVDCKLSKWFAGVCDKSCGGGSKKFTRVVVTPSTFGGKACGASLQRVDACNTQACPADCKLSEWSKWSECSRTCSQGTRARTRTVVFPEKHGGRCPVLFQRNMCNEGPCPVHCVVGTWSKWSKCSKTCGGGKMRRKRPVISHGKHGGYKCPFTSDAQSCATDICPVDCVLSKWGKLSACSVTCGTGVRVQQRKIVKKPKHGGKACAATHRSDPCAVDCSVDCVVGSWGSWGPCNVQCGTGTKDRTRPIMTKAFWDGDPCPTTVIHAICNTHDCTPAPTQKPTQSPTAEPTIVKWRPKPCRNGETVPMPLFGRATTNKNWRSLNEPFNENQGTLAGNMHLMKSGPWKIQIDVVPNKQHPTDFIEASIGDSFLGAFRGDRDSNTITYETGAIEHFKYKFSWTTPGQYKWHKHVDIKRAVATCIREERDCKVAKWGKWSGCSATCGGGKHTRQRKVSISRGKHGGKECPALIETKPCNTKHCPYIATIQAEDSKSITKRSGLLVSDSVAGFNGKGYVQFPPASKQRIQWMVTVPHSGRYTVDFRYWVDDHTHVALETENIVVDHKEREKLTFKPSSTWAQTTTHVTLYKGPNSISLTTTGTAGPYLDQITIAEEHPLERCTPGEVIPLKFVADANKRSDINSEGKISDGSLSGSMSGWLELHKLGMWDIEINLKGGDIGGDHTPEEWKSMANGYAKLELAGHTFGPVHNTPDLEMHPLTFQTSNAHLKYKFDLEAMRLHDSASRMQVLEGKAICAGCPSVRCEMRAHKFAHKPRSGPQSSKTLHVTHMSARQADAQGIELLEGQHSHSCKYNKKYKFCQCKCNTPTDARSNYNKPGFSAAAAEMTP